MTRFARLSAVISLVCAGLWLASSDSILRAQTASTPQQRQLLMIQEINLKPDTAPEWAELMKAETISAQKKAGLPWRDSWANGPGGDPYLRAVVTPISSLAQYDSPNPMAKALGEQGYAAYQAKNRRLTASARSTIVTTRPDLGFGTRPTTYNIAILTTVNVTNGRAADFESFLKTDIVPALKKAGVTYYSVAQVVFGDDANKFMTLLPVNDYAELAKGHPLERALGADGMTKIVQKSGAFISRIERRIIRYLPDLSYRPAAATSN